MPSRPIRTAAVIAAWLLTTPLAAQVPDSTAARPASGTAAAVAYDYYAALATDSMVAAARLLEPEGLAAFRSTFVAFAGTEAGGEILGLFEVASPAELNQLDPARVFARFLEFSTEQGGNPLEVLADASFRIVGEVPEGAALVHVLARITTNVDGNPFSDVEVVTVMRTGEGWRVRLPGQVRLMLASLQAALSEMIQ